MEVSLIVRYTKVSLHHIAQVLTSLLSMRFRSGKQTVGNSDRFEFGQMKERLCDN